MLDNHYNLREMEQKHQIMENRLKRLEDEEKRAQKNQLAAEKKAAEMLQARSRHYQDLMEKIKFYEEKNNMMELQKMKNQLDQKQRKQGIQFNREQWMAGNWDSKKRMEQEAQILKNTKAANDAADMEYKK